MGSLRNQTYLQAFLGKLFGGIAGLIFDKTNIIGFHSLSKENLNFLNPVSTLVPPEMWLKNVETGMKQSLYINIYQALKDYQTTKSEYGNILDKKLFASWVEKWPGQVILLVSNIMFNKDME